MLITKNYKQSFFFSLMANGLKIQIFYALSLSDYSRKLSLNIKRAKVCSLLYNLQHLPLKSLFLALLSPGVIMRVTSSLHSAWQSLICIPMMPREDKVTQKSKYFLKIIHLLDDHPSLWEQTTWVPGRRSRSACVCMGTLWCCCGMIPMMYEVI